MDEVFSASKRLWIGDRNFNGSVDTGWLRTFGKNLTKKYVEDLYERMKPEDEVETPFPEEGNSVSEENSSEGIGDESKKEAVLKKIAELGDAFFGETTSKKKRQTEKGISVRPTLGSNDDDTGDTLSEDDHNTEAATEDEGACATEYSGDCYSSGRDELTESELESDESNIDLQDLRENHSEESKAFIRTYARMSNGPEVPRTAQGLLSPAAATLALTSSPSGSGSAPAQASEPGPSNSRHSAAQALKPMPSTSKYRPPVLEPEPSPSTSRQVGLLPDALPGSSASRGARALGLDWFDLGPSATSSPSAGFEHKSASKSAKGKSKFDCPLFSFPSHEGRDKGEKFIPAEPPASQACDTNDEALYGQKAMKDYFKKYQKDSFAKLQKEQEECPEHARRQKILRTVLGMDDRKEEFEALSRMCTLGYPERAHLPIVEKPVAQGSAMTVLAPPIPAEALKRSKAIAIATNFSKRPGVHPWKCKSVNDQISSDIGNRKELKERDKITSYLETCDPSEKVDNSTDALFTFVFYKQSGRVEDQRTKQDPEMAVTLNVLGSQTLEELRDQFYCQNDLICTEMFEDDLPPSRVYDDAYLKSVREPNLKNPCALFVGQTIYTNEAGRADKDWDYGAALKAWASSGEREMVVGPFSAEKLEETRVRDLSFKFGFPYVFIHQGNCEHLVVIEQVRLLHSKDSPLRSSYPAILRSNFKTVLCSLDHKKVARYAVRETTEFPEDPMLLCRGCLESFCYQGNKRAFSFKLFEYLQFSALF